MLKIRLYYYKLKFTADGFRRLIMMFNNTLML